MKILLAILAITGLALTLIPAILVFTGKIEFATHKQLMFAGFLLWFAVAPFWMKEGGA